MARLTAGALAALFAVTAAPAGAQALPELTAPVNDFAGVIDPSSAGALGVLIRSLERASGDAIAVATVDTFAPYGDIRQYAVELFENGGRGIGQRGRDNGLLVVVAVEDREVWVEVGYDLEQFVTDGFAGQVSRQSMAPAFARGAYGEGLVDGVSQIVARVADRRGVTLQGIPSTRPVQAVRRPGPGGFGPLVGLFVLFSMLNALGLRRRRRYRRWGMGPWSGWSSGVGPFGGGFGGFGGGRGGGFGGGFGGFGGGRSGGGGGGASW